MSKIEKTSKPAEKAVAPKKESPVAVEPVKTEPVTAEPIESMSTEPIEPVKAINEPQETSTVKEEPTVEAKPEKVTVDWNKAYEDMTIEELQEAILEKMRKNGPVTDYMLGTVRENTHKGSLISWVKSFN